MYRVTKTLNHNTLLARKENSAGEYLIMGKGIGFGKKVNERIEPNENCSIYSLQDTAVCDAEVSNAMQIGAAVRACIMLIEKETGKNIDEGTLSCNRLINHIHYMVARLRKKEDLKVNMNHYMEHQFPVSFAVAMVVCDYLSEYLKQQLPEIEIGYLAMHIERVLGEEVE